MTGKWTRRSWSYKGLVGLHFDPASLVGTGFRGHRDSTVDPPRRALGIQDFSVVAPFPVMENGWKEVRGETDGYLPGSPGSGEIVALKMVVSRARSSISSVKILSSGPIGS